LLARVASLYVIEAEIRGHRAERRRPVRQERSRPIVEALYEWLQAQLPREPGASDLARAMRYAIKRWPGLVAFLDDVRIEMDTNVVERAIRPITLERVVSGRTKSHELHSLLPWNWKPMNATAPRATQPPLAA
jgi:transposase